MRVKSEIQLPNSLLIFSLRHRWWARVGIFLLALLGAFAGLAAPIFQKVFIDRVLGTEPLAASKLGIEWLARLSPIEAVFGAFAAALGAQLIGLVGNYVSLREATILQRIFSEALYRKTLAIRADSLGSTTVGEVVSIYATDVNGATALLDQVLPMAVLIVCNMVLAPLAIYWICGIPMWATLVLIAIVILVTLALGIRQGRFFWRFKQLAAERSGLVNEWVQSIRLLRILGWVESFEKKIFTKRIEETLNRVRMVTNGQFMNAFGSSVNFIITLTGVASLIHLSGRRVTPGELFAMMWIFGVFLQRPFRQLPWFFTFSVDSTTSMARLEKFFARKSDAGRVEAPDAPPDALPDALPDLGAESVRVRGLELEIGGDRILKDIDFDLRAGEFVAVVGEVGSGKSMLVLSLVGETGASFKTFEIGGQNALTLDLNDRRRHFSFVPQEGFVMSASLRENIVFNYEPSVEHDARVLRSLELAQFKIADEIQGPGLDTEIGERGVNLSGGQRQRVSLARARYFNRPVILLDDCLSAVDVDTERKLVGELLDGDWNHCTRLLVTHRLSVLHMVDRIFFMENGAIVETGSFDELLKTSSRMRAFVASVQRSEQSSPSSVSGVGEPTSLAHADGSDGIVASGVDAASGEGEGDADIETLS